MCAGSKSQLLLFDINTVYHHVYYAEGTYELTANISSQFSWGFLTAEIIVAKPVVNMMWVIPVAHASVNVSFVAGVAMDMGSNVTLVWDFGDSSFSAVVEKKRTGVFHILSLSSSTFSVFFYVIKKQISVPTTGCVLHGGPPSGVVSRRCTVADMSVDNVMF